MKYLKRAYAGFENGKHAWAIKGQNDIGGYSDAYVYTEDTNGPTEEEALKALEEAQRIYLEALENDNNPVIE